MTAPPTILALGSPHADDQVGWRLIERLTETGASPLASVRIASPWDIVPYMQSGGAWIIVDACRSGAPLGAVHRFTASELQCVPSDNRSTHGGSLREALDLCMALGYDLSRAQVYAIEIGDASPGGPLSPEVRQAAVQLADQLSQEWAANSITS